MRTQTSTEAIRAWWTDGDNNWGDIIAPQILRALAGAQVIRSQEPGSLYSVGSTLSWLCPDCSVWGAGLLSSRHVPAPFPKNIVFHAVRGPLTRDALVKKGVDVPEVYGDPAILVPYLFQSKRTPEYDLGIILHYKDRGYITEVKTDLRHKFIDVTQGAFEVIQNVLDCRAIASSSLHGVILAEAYGRRCAWLQVDRGKRLVGRDFKFRDYFLSTNRTGTPSRIWRHHPIVVDKLKWLSSPTFPAEQLLRACPVSKYSRLVDLPATDVDLGCA